VAFILDRKGLVGTAEHRQSWSQEPTACELRLPLCPDVRQLSTKRDVGKELGFRGVLCWSAAAVCGQTHTHTHTTHTHAHHTHNTNTHTHHTHIHTHTHTTQHKHTHTHTPKGVQVPSNISNSSTTTHLIQCSCYI